MTTPYRYVRKVMAVGNSLVVSLPTIWVKANKITSEKKVSVEVHPDKLVIVLFLKNGS